MFRNLLIYKLPAGWQASLAELEAALAAVPFVECGSTQPVSMGWVSPRGVAHGAVVESVAGQFHAALQIEKKILPGSVVKRRLDELAAQVTKDSGRKPGKKHQRELKDQAMLELLPRAFTKRGQVRVWLAFEPGLLMIDAASPAMASEVITQLVQAFTGVTAPGFNVLPLNTALSPAVLMRDWLASDEPPAIFGIDRECELKSADEQKSVVRYARHALDTDEVKSHLEGGKTPTRLALTWNSRVSFTLTETSMLKKIEFLDVVMEGRAEREPSDQPGAHFDADAAIATGELEQLITDLIEALGGEAEAAAPAVATSPAPGAALDPAGGQASARPADEAPPWA
ncbi:MAG: recombination-associated protein RdgC [Burkholderiales bacterium]|nr:recombination-associated protein RdgC [Burkholderiales bacterium]